MSIFARHSDLQTKDQPDWSCTAFLGIPSWAGKWGPHIRYQMGHLIALLPPKYMRVSPNINASRWCLCTHRQVLEQSKVPLLPLSACTSLLGRPATLN